MCYAKPGPRCSDHTSKDLAKADEALSQDPSNPTLQKERHQAYKDWLRSPKGIEQLEQQAAEESNPERAADLLAQAEANKALRAEAIAKWKEAGSPTKDRPQHKRETLEEKLARLSDELEEGVEGLNTDAGWHRYLRTMATFHTYSWRNQLLIQLQRPDASLVAGFNRWKAVNRSVRKGERGITILAPKALTVPVLDKNNEPVTDEDGKPVRKKVIKGFTTVTVFDISQTEGEPIDDYHRPLTTEPPAGLSDDLKSAITVHGYQVREEEIPGRADGYTRNSGGIKEVVVRSSLPEGQKVKVLAHELGHIALGHMEEDRAGAYHTGHNGQRGAMEVEAEGYAYVMCRANGMDLADAQQGTTGYIGGWSMVQDGSKADTKTVKTSAEAIAQAVTKSLKEHSWANVAPDPVANAPAVERPARRSAKRKSTTTRKGGKSSARRTAATPA